MIKSLSLLVFSPTGSTRRVVSRIGNYLSNNVSQCNLLQRNIEKFTFSAQDVVVVGVPVYGGRVPDLAMKAIRNFTGTSTPVVSVVVYGNRAYEDALVELNDALTENGFVILASAAFVAQHSIARSIGQGRPDIEDRDEIDEFCRAVGEKYARVDRSQWAEINVPGNRPYKEYVPAKVVPYIGEGCTKCRTCINECPVGAVTLESTDESKCFLCMRCVSVCPQKARRLPEAYLEKVLAYLQDVCPGRTANQVFI